MTPTMWVLVAIFLLTTAITAYLTFMVVRQVFAGKIKPDNIPNLSLADSTAEAAQVNPFSLNTPMQPAGGPTPEPWDGASRVTILLMGLDYRDWEGEGPSRTDTMILFTLDPVAGTAGMLSIPRDLWVYIPGFDYGKINTAYYLGEVYDDLSGGGPGLAIATVEQLLGVSINYYAQVDFSAFERLIDEIGGIEVEVPEEITIDPLGPANTITLQPGLQTLDGPAALAYARNRDTIGGDFDRSQRQQQVILAMRSRIISLKMLPTLVSNAGAIYQELSSGILTNMTLQEAIQLAWLAKDVGEGKIVRRAIGPDHVTFSYSPDGMDILIPDSDAIRALRDEVFASEGAIAPAENVSGDPQQLMAGESATVSVLNATLTPGLASQTTDYLTSKGVYVTITGNAQELASYTAIIDYTGKPYTVQYLIDLLGIQSSNIFSRYDPNSDVDIAILLGDDWASQQPIP